MYRNIVSSVIIGLTSPALLVYELARSRSWYYRRWLATLFFTFLGSVVVLKSGDGLDHYQDLLDDYVEMPWSHFVDELWRILTFQLTETHTKDVYKHILSYLVGTVLGIPGLFFPIVATVYGYFFSGSVLIILRNFRISKVNYVILIFVGIFFFVRGLDGFYTVRTWTGMWILVYSCLRYFETGKRKYIALMFVPPFIHVGFFLLAIPAWIVLVFGNRPLLYVAVFLVSSVTTVLPVQETTTLLSSTERGASQVEAYQVDERLDRTARLEEFQAQTNWYNAFRRAGFQRWAPTVLVFVLVLSGVYTRVMTAFQQKVFSVGLLTLALSNATWFLFAVHNRSLTVAMIFLLAGFLISRLNPVTSSGFKGLPQYYRLGLYLSILLFSPLIIFHMSITLDWMSVFMFGFPIFVWWDPEANMSVKEFLRLVFQ